MLNNEQEEQGKTEEAKEDGASLTDLESVVELSEEPQAKAVEESDVVLLTDQEDDHEEWFDAEEDQEKEEFFDTPEIPEEEEPQPEQQRYAAWTCGWMAKQTDSDKDYVLAQFKTWCHEDRRPEATVETIAQIRRLSWDHRIAALSELRERPKYAMGRKNQRELEVNCTLQTVSDGRTLDTKGLIDSGCTGTMIDSKFVEKHGLEKDPVLRPIPVYNGDGTLSKTGVIRYTVTLRLRVGEHESREIFGVTDLGKSDIFIGHDWLSFHNPEIDWHVQEIKFSRCPELCGFEPEWNRTINEDENGDRLFLFDVPGYCQREEIIRRVTTSSELAQAANAAKPKQHWKNIVPSRYHEFADIFTKEGFDELPPHRPWDHAIELKPGSEPRDCKVYPISPNEDQALRDFIEENLKTGRIRPSQSPMASPFFFIKKKDGSLRPIQDYRKLNEMTIKNRYPLPLISEIMDKLSGAKYFTKFDIRWGYNNVRIKDDDVWKAAFKTKYGLFEPLVMFFGLCNAPATFQSMMNGYFRDMIASGEVLVYIDDIIVLGKTLEDNRRITRKVLERLREHNLFVKPEKCEFETQKTEYLGLIISEGRLEMDPVKISGVRDWPIPACKKEVQAFLGFCNFYRRFVKGYSKVARPLNDLTGNVPWKWTPEAETAVHELKKRLTEAPALVIPNESDPYRVEVDASDYAIGGVLSQKQDNVWHPVAYLSHSMTPAERNYEIYDKELLAIMTGIEQWRHYLLGAKHTFEIYTDHKNLEFFRQPQKLNRRQARWLTELADYDFALIHRPGSTNTKADLLSRRADHTDGKEDNREVVLLREEFFRVRHAIDDVNWISPITRKRLDECLAQIRNQEKWILEKADQNQDGFRWEDGFVMLNERYVVPKDRKLRLQIIQDHHDTPEAGHPGQTRTWEQVSRSYWWPGIRAQIKQYVTTCVPCQQNNIVRKDRSTLRPNEVPKFPFEVITLDQVTGIPVSQGYDALLNFVCRLTKKLISVPCNKELSAENTARLYMKHVYRHYGLPRKVISDRGPQFVAGFMKALYKSIGITGNPSTAYHPQTDGQTERAHQDIEKYLRTFCNYRQNDWAEWLPIMEFVYNDSVHTSTGYSPHFLLQGFHPRKGNAPVQTGLERTDLFLERIERIREDAIAALEHVNDKMRKPSTGPKYKPGDKVWLDTKHVNLHQPSKKLSPQRIGPFEIVKAEGSEEVAWRLKLPAKYRIHPVVHESRLLPYNTDQSEIPRPGPRDMDDLMDEPMDAESIAEIIGHRVHETPDGRKAVQYLCRWAGKSEAEATWEVWDTLRAHSELVQEYHRQHPDAPKFRIWIPDRAIRPNPHPKHLYDPHTGNLHPAS